MASITCYDCERFGISCKGVVPPMEFRDHIDQYCKEFKMVEWRKQLYKPGGKSRL